MSADEVPPEVQPPHSEILKEWRTQYQQDLQLYVDLLETAMSRASKLIDAAMQSKSETADDIYRAVVVMTHAYLEDFLRTIAMMFLPNADEHILDAVPLAGLGNKNRPEKFFLGKLVQHRGKKVEDLIRESVAEYLEHMSFNNVTEIISLLKGIGVTLPETENWEAELGIEWRDSQKSDKRRFAKLDEMIRRRHNIVHRADKAKAGDGLLAIDPHQVLDWMKTVSMFIGIMAKNCVAKQHPYDEARKILEAKMGATKVIESK